MASISGETRIDFVLCKPREFVLQPGLYWLEVVGASGGNSELSFGGTGGRSVGALTLDEPTKIFVHVGEKGMNSMYATSDFTPESCGGGGKAKKYTTNPIGSGGGSTDIRIGTDDLLHQVIVAGGGSGAGWGNDAETKQKGGDGGGRTGEDGQGEKAGCGGSEDGCSDKCLNGGTCPPGQLQKGGSATSSNKADAGGGGGLFGGAASMSRYAAGGGSGYVFTEGVSTDLKITLLDKKYLLVNATTNKYDNIGNGYAVIRPIEIQLPKESICRKSLPINTFAIISSFALLLS